MPKGYQDETCAEAIRAAIKPGEVITFSGLFGRVKSRGAWRDSTIWQHLMSLVVNLPPARHQWPSSKPFLFLRGDGQYEVYNPAVHPRVRS